jgi:hypothetical protein
MAARGWGGSVAVAIGVAAATAAAALGLGYGLSIVTWPTAVGAAADDAWLASLTWTAWIAASATLFGAVVADRLSAGDPGAAPPRRRSTMKSDGAYRRATPNAFATATWRIIIALSAAVGALAAVPLVAVPARAAHRPDTYAPQLIAGGYAVVGVTAGLIVAVLALSARAIAANAILTTGWLWLLAIASVVRDATPITSHTAFEIGVPAAQLAIWHFDGHFINGTISLPGAGLMLGAALVIGALAAWPALRRGDNRVGVAVSGAAGPVLVAAAYFLAAPKLTTVRVDERLSAYLIAPYTVLIGLAGSVLFTALVTYRADQAANRAAAAVPTSAGASTMDDNEGAHAAERVHVGAPEPAATATPEPAEAAAPVSAGTVAGAATATKPARGRSRRKPQADRDPTTTSPAMPAPRESR